MEIGGALQAALQSGLIVHKVCAHHGERKMRVYQYLTETKLHCIMVYDEYCKCTNDYNDYSVGLNYSGGIAAALVITVFD